MEDDLTLIFIGIFVGALFSALLVGAVTDTHDDAYWQMDALAHGYAHYSLDHQSHWNNESQK